MKKKQPGTIRHTFVFGLCIIFALLCLFAARQVSAVAPIPATDTQQVKRFEGKRIGRSIIKVEFTWDTPTQREDSTPLPLSEIDHYVIEYSREGQVKTVNTGKRNYFVLALIKGTYSFRIATVDTDGQQGNFSEPINLTL